MIRIISENLIKRYKTAQYRLISGAPLILMGPETLQILVICSYLLRNTFHHIGENVDVREEAAEILRNNYGWTLDPDGFLNSIERSSEQRPGELSCLSLSLCHHCHRHLATERRTEVRREIELEGQGFSQGMPGWHTSRDNAKERASKKLQPLQCEVDEFVLTMTVS